MTWNITAGIYKGVAFHTATAMGLPFGVTDQSEDVERRLQVSEKALIDGADVEDFGRKARTYSATVVFFSTPNAPDYLPYLKQFEDILNDGKSGILILPDVENAIWAKFQKSSRKSSAADGSSTSMTVSWIEDNTTAVLPSQYQAIANANKAIQEKNNTPALPTIFDQAALVAANAAKATSTLSLNSSIAALTAAQSAIVNTLTSINNVLNVGRNARQSILNAVQTAKTDLAAVQGIAAGITTLADALSLGLSAAAPTRYNTGVGAIDFVAPDVVSTTVVAGVSTIQVTTPPVQQIGSFPEGVEALQIKVAALQANRASIESKTQGATNDFTASSITLENSMIDLIAIMKTSASRTVMTQTETSLLEVLFQNSLSIDMLESVHELNPDLDDILDIPPYTVLNI
jgi:prophage DNA circulation protein